MEEVFLPFFLVLLAAVAFSTLLRRWHVPWVVTLMIGGIVLGPEGLDLLEINQTIDFLGQVGLVFLMFMAGMETRASRWRELRWGLGWLTLINGLVPMVVGFGIGWAFGFSPLQALLLGIVFISSSIAVVMPTLEARGMLASRIGNAVVVAIMLQDIASLILLSLVLQTARPLAQIPLPAFYLILGLAVLGMRWFVPKLQRILGGRGGRDSFQQELRSVLLLLMGAVILFELLGLHPIVGGFFAGFVLSGVITSEILKAKIRAVSYGVFVPTFFVIVGAQTQVSVLANSVGAGALAVAIVVGSLGAKLVSGWVGARLAGFNNAEAGLFGAASVPQLSTTLAVAVTALSLGLFDQSMMAALVALSMVTTLASPVLMSLAIRRLMDKT